MSGWTGLVIAATTGGYALVSGRLARTAVSGPMVFVAVGLAVGPLGLDLISLSHEGSGIRELVEAALALLLFTDALAIQVKALRRDEFLPIRLLGAGLPLTIALGWLLAWPLLPGLSRWELALAGVILAGGAGALVPLLLTLVVVVFDCPLACGVFFFPRPATKSAAPITPAAEEPAAPAAEAPATA